MFESEFFIAFIAPTPSPMFSQHLVVRLSLRAMWAPSFVAVVQGIAGSVVEEVVPEHGNDNDTPEVVPEVAA